MSASTLPAETAELAFARKDILRIATAGSVDDGKSTLIGRLLYDTKSVLADQLSAVEAATLARGGGEVDEVALACPLDRLVLVLEDRLAVVQPPADQRALAVVDRARGRDPQDVLAGDRDVVRVLGLGGVDVDGAAHQK